MPPTPKEVGTHVRGGGGAGFAKGLYPPYRVKAIKRKVHFLQVFGSDCIHPPVPLKGEKGIGNLPSETEALDYVLLVTFHQR